jgi:hypothetical protein
MQLELEKSNENCEFDTPHSPIPPTHYPQQATVPKLDLDLVLIGDPRDLSITTTNRSTKNQFWKKFICERLREELPNHNQNTHDDSQSKSARFETESEEDFRNKRVFNYFVIDPLDEIEKRKKGLLRILKANFEKQNMENSNEEIIDAPLAIENIEFLMDQIANLTLKLASILNQEGGNLQYDDSDFQGIQNSTKHDPIIYSGVGIRIKLENENGDYYLRITEIFENSDLDKSYKDKKITHVKCEGSIKSIKNIYEECGEDEEKFNTIISIIFRDEKQNKLTLKIDGEDSEKTVNKNIFIPSERKDLNIKDDDQVMRIATKLREAIPVSSRLEEKTKGSKALV